MPSDAKKKRDLAKKQAAKGKGGLKPKATANGDSEIEKRENEEDLEDSDTPTTNGHTTPTTNGNGDTNGTTDDTDDIVKRDGT